MAENLFSDRPLVRPDGTFALKDLAGIKWQELVARSPAYFSTLYRKFRGRDEYSKAVYHSFQKIYGQLNSSPPVRAAWIALLKEIPQGTLPALGSSMGNNEKK